MDQNEYVKCEFSYIDEFGQESRMVKTISTNILHDVITPFALLVDEFKSFMVGAGFLQSQVNKIQFVEDEDDDDNNWMSDAVI